MKLFFIIVSLMLSSSLFGQTKTKADTASLTPEIRGKILNESKNGGTLDFWTPIKGHEYDGEMLQGGGDAKDNIYATKKEIAIIKWALVLTKRGIIRNDLISLYEELKARKIRNDEISLIEIGIKKAAG